MLTKYLLPIEPEIFLTDGGLETTLIFDHDLELTEFAAFDLLKNHEHSKLIKDYYRPYINIAKQQACGFVLESPTWRASAVWGESLAYSKAELKLANETAINLLKELRYEYATPELPILISGCLGPRQDAYLADQEITVEQSHHYHKEQITWLCDAGVDLICAMTLTNIAEAIGIANAAGEAGIPAVISFTVETDGKLPTGETLAYAIEQTDCLAEVAPAYYMINCAHPTHFADVIKEGDWRWRIGGVRSNASCKSHAELDEASELDRGNPQEFGAQHKSLRELLPNLRIYGGCCGTSFEHIDQIAANLLR